MVEVLLVLDVVVVVDEVAEVVANDERDDVVPVDEVEDADVVEDDETVDVEPVEDVADVDVADDELVMVSACT